MRRVAIADSARPAQTVAVLDGAGLDVDREGFGASSPVEKPEAQSTGLRGKNAALWLTGELAFEATDGTVIVFEAALAKRMATFLLPIFEASA